MVIFSHMHLIRKENFDRETYDHLGVEVPEDTHLENLVSWLREAGVVRAVVMGQDMTRIRKSTFGERYVLEAIRKYPDLFIGLSSLEPMDVNCPH